MMQYVSLYYFFEKPLLKILRIIVGLFLLGFLGMSVVEQVSLKLPLILLSLATMAEIFFHFKLAHLYPTQKLTDNPTDIQTAATMPTLAAATITNPQSFTHFLLNQKDIRFMLSRMEIKPSEIASLPVDPKLLINKATEYAKITHTTYIDTPHLFAAYLLLTEEQTKLLFQKELKEIDLLRLIVWTQLAYPTRQKTHKHFQVIGDGYGEELTHGWTYETKKYTLDWTTEVLRNKPEMFGNTDIFQQIIGTLSQPQHNNVLLIGEPGCGKHLLIDILAFESYNGSVPHNLQHKRVLTLMIGSLLAGMNNPSELQTRLQTIMAELSHAQVILAIPEIQDILGSSAFNIDLSSTLLPYLQNGSFPIIATITPENYKRYVEHNPLKDVFSPITLPQPDTETLFGMLFMAVLALEQHQQLQFSYLSLVKAVELAGKFDPTGVLPGSAVKLLEATGTALLVKGRNDIQAQDIADHVEETTHVPVSAPKGEEKELLMHLEDVLHKKVIGQEEAIAAIAEGMRRLRSGLSSTTKPISFLFLGPTGVGKTETAKALADTYYHGTAHMLRFDMSEYSSPDGVRRLLGATPGQGEEKGELTEKVFDHPSSLILLDEFEKASPAILDLFLQVLDDGRLTDNKGKTVSFTNCIIIATSNAGSEYIREHITHTPIINKAFHQELLNNLQTQHLFKPELLNRFDEVVIFKPLDSSQVITITSMLLQILVNRLQEQDISLTIDPTVIQKIAQESFNPELGARPIQRYIQASLDDLIAKGKLDGTLVRGSKAIFVLDTQGNILLQASS